MLALGSVATKALALLARVPWYGWAIAGVGAVAAVSKAAPASAAEGAPPPVPPGPLPLLKLGSTGPAVKLLQWALSLPQTGSFDAPTETAVKAYQTKEGLTPDGKVGPKTWSSLGFEGAPSSSSSSTPGPAATPAPAPIPGTVVDPFDLAADVPTREGQILAALAAGHARVELVPITWQACGHTAAILVTRRAVAISHAGQVVVPSMSFNLAQKVADLLGGALPSTRVLDEIHKQADLRIQPLIRSWNTDSPPTGTTTKRLLEQSAAIEAAVGGHGGLVSGEGKDWVITRRFFLPPAGTGVEKPHEQSGSRHNAANFGLYGGPKKSPGGESVHQPIGLVHGRPFVDYSQLLRLVQPDSLMIDGQSFPGGWAAALADPAISCVVQDEGGIIPSPRHPDL